MMDATVNNTRDVSKQTARPKISLSEAMTGMNTALVRRYDVPIQNPCTAVPCNSVDIFVKDVIMMDASKETMRDVTASDSIIRSS